MQKCIADPDSIRVLNLVVMCGLSHHCRQLHHPTEKSEEKKNMHASIRKVSICGWLFMFTSLLLALHKVLMSL